MSSPEISYRNHPRRRFNRHFKREVVEILLEQAATVAEVARAYDLHPNQLCRWRNEYFRGEYGAVIAATPSVPTRLPVALVDTDAEPCVAIATAATPKCLDMPVVTKRLGRLRVILPKGQIHLEEVEPETLGLLIEALR
ncbi:transposase [Parapusillimonas granuli]|uniref:Transposase n=1 Tax=Parapusillimonas granuli TaxID=380911 RepID=A0A853FUC5_9BURK|nr:transposase [Parapusillimonas granuli]MBB5217405.1 transposase-like protein [Parapusillimonas granuli]NYT47749.1 transposase [Parapusillimonas granuli]